MTPPPRLAGIYCRLSYAEDGSEEKVDRQEDDCRTLADRMAWPISEQHLFKDNNRSAWRRNRRRPGWDDMLAAIDAGQIDAVLVYHGDRLIRQPWDLELLLNIAREKGIRLASPSGTRNLDSPDDQFILRIEAAQACRASDDTSRRVKRALKAKRINGYPRPGGRRAFGFETDNHTVREWEVDLIREAAERLLAGQSLYGVLKWLNGVTPTGGGGRWESRVFRTMMASPRLVGLLEHDGEIVGPAVWDPILEPEVWHEVNRLLAEKTARFPDFGNKVQYMLSGIALCSSCGGPLKVNKSMGKRQKRPYRTYMCKNKKCPLQVSRSVAHLDAYVSGRVVQVLNDPDFVATLYSESEDPGLAAQISTLEQRMAQAQQQLKKLADFPEVDPADLVEGIASLNRKIMELRGRRESTARRRLLRRMAGVTRGQWEAEPLDVRRSTVAALFRVEVLPAARKGRGFDPERVRVTLVDEA